MLSATCHCGAVRIEIPRRPRTLTNCNCSICRRYGPLWAYYQRAEVKITSEAGATEAYSWGDKQLRFVRCAHCGCIINWERLHAPEEGRVGVNARNFEPELLGPVRIKRLDGAKSWRLLRDDE
ncbi:MAG TPA: GFA family protein [Burkholderiaceae bacterium]